MERRVAILAAVMSLAALFYLAVVSASSRAQAPTTKPNLGLEQKVARLEEQVADLQRQVEELKRRSAVVMTVPSAPGRDWPQALVARPGQNLPPSSTPFQFNGMTVYKVPLSGAHGSDAVVPQTAPK